MVHYCSCQYLLFWNHFLEPNCAMFLVITCWIVVVFSSIGKIISCKVKAFGNAEWNFLAETDFGFRHKRQMPLCSDGTSRAVASCLRPQMKCSPGYRCEVATGFCCPIVTGPKLCPGGNKPTAMCVKKTCNLGLQCITVGSSDFCCRGGKTSD